MQALINGLDPQVFFAITAPKVEPKPKPVIRNIAIAGSRNWQDHQGVIRAMQGLNAELFISGGAKGPDSQAEQYLRSQHKPFLAIKADWQAHGKAAGFIRNKAIIEKADKLIAFWDCESQGTSHAIALAVRKRIPVEIHIPDGKRIPRVSEHIIPFQGTCWLTREQLQEAMKFGPVKLEGSCAQYNNSNNWKPITDVSGTAPHRWLVKTQGMQLQQLPMKYLDYLAGQPWLYGAFEQWLYVYLERESSQLLLKDELPKDEYTVTTPWSEGSDCKMDYGRQKAFHLKSIHEDDFDLLLGENGFVTISKGASKLTEATAWQKAMLFIEQCEQIHTKRQIATELCLEDENFQELRTDMRFWWHLCPAKLKQAVKAAWTDMLKRLRSTFVETFDMDSRKYVKTRAKAELSKAEYEQLAGNAKPEAA